MPDADTTPALLGDAVMDRGSWFASEIMDSPMVKSYRSAVKVYGNRCDWFMTPATARSMASALQHFADRAEAFDKTTYLTQPCSRCGHDEELHEPHCRCGNHLGDCPCAAFEKKEDENED